MLEWVEACGQLLPIISLLGYPVEYFLLPLDWYKPDKIDASIGGVRELDASSNRNRFLSSYRFLSLDIFLHRPKKTFPYFYHS